MGKSSMIGSALVAAAVTFLALGGQAYGAAPTHWTASWAAAQMAPSAADLASHPEQTDTLTLRQIAHLSIGGSKVRVRLSNVFGTEPLHVLGLHLARAHAADSPATDPRTDRAVHFMGAEAVTIPPGAEYWSDPVDIAVPARGDLAVSLLLDRRPERLTGHPGSRATSYILAGDALAAALPTPMQTIDRWFVLAELDVATPAKTGAIAAFGDSITDGHGATTNRNDRWTDVAADRLSVGPHPRGLVNLGIGGNRILLDGLGPNAVARFDRDVLDRPGIDTVVILEGVNDLGVLNRDASADGPAHTAMVAQLKTAYAQMAARAKQAGIRVIGATILPFTGYEGYHPGAAREADRQAINQWIRHSGAFDAVIDFDRVMADPAHPERMSPAYDSGDHLHPSPVGYRAMGEAAAKALAHK